LGEFSWGPDRRARPAADSVAGALLAVVIVALLAAGAVGVAVHHKSTSTASSPPPAGFQRLADTTDQISVAVPPGWRAVTLTADTLRAQMQALAATDPQISVLVQAALAAVQKFQVGLFAIDETTGATVFSYGSAQPGAKIGDFKSSDAVSQLRSGGGQNVHATLVHLPLGPGQRISVQLPVASQTVSEYLDYFVYRGRLVFLVVAVRSTQLPTALLHQIEATLAPA
jgi:hypothetical protein